MSDRAATRDLWSLPRHQALVAAGRVRPADGRPKQLAAMQARHGAGPAAARCGDCYHCKRVTGNTISYRKCDLYGYSHGPGTDWRQKWPACGRFDGDQGEIRRRADIADEAARVARQARRHEAMASAYHAETGRWWHGDRWPIRHAPGSKRARRAELATEAAVAFAAAWYEAHPEEDDDAERV